jgi:hypothetical protein
MGGECSQKLRPRRRIHSSLGRNNIRLSRESTLYLKDLAPGPKPVSGPFLFAAKRGIRRPTVSGGLDLRVPAVVLWDGRRKQWCV